LKIDRRIPTDSSLPKSGGVWLLLSDSTCFFIFPTFLLHTRLTFFVDISISQNAKFFDQVALGTKNKTRYKSASVDR